MLNWIKNCKQRWWSFDSEPTLVQGRHWASDAQWDTHAHFLRPKSKVHNACWVDFKSFSLNIQRRLGEQHLFTKGADRRPHVWHYQLCLGWGKILGAWVLYLSRADYSQWHGALPRGLRGKQPRPEKPDKPSCPVSNSGLSTFLGDPCITWLMGSRCYVCRERTFLILRMVLLMAPRGRQPRNMLCRQSMSHQKESHHQLIWLIAFKLSDWLAMCVCFVFFLKCCICWINVSWLY